MVPYIGNFLEDEVIYIMFNTVTATDPNVSCTITDFINTDVHIHKDDGLDQRNNAAGITVSVDFDGITGSHMIKIDTSDNTVVGFWAIGSDYFVRIEGTTVNAGTINKVVAQFGIENRCNKVNVTHISDDSTAVDNIEAMYDGTGYIADTAPATQSQLSTIANVGSPSRVAASSYSLTTGTQTANAYTDTEELNGTRHTHIDSGNSMVLEYVFNIGAGTPTEVKITGALVGGNDDLEVMAYDYISTSYKQVGILVGKASSANEVNTYDLFIGMVGTGSSLGEVKIKLQDGAYTLSNATLYIDQISASFSSASSSYEEGAIWVNDEKTNTNTVPNRDGTATNPVSTWAAALTLSSLTNIEKFHVAAGMTVTLTANSDGYEIYGWEWTLALGSQSIAGAHITGATVTGVSSGTNARFFFCKMAVGSSVSLEACGFKDCALGSSGIILLSAGTYLMADCFSANSDTYIDFEDAAENKSVYVSRHGGNIELRNFGHATGIHIFSITGQGHIEFNSNCDAANAADILYPHGMFYITDNVSGGWGGTTNEEARIDATQIEDSVWDTALTGSSHNTSTTAGRRLREIASCVVLTGTSPNTGGTANTSTRIELDSDASSTDGAYDPSVISITGGIGIGQSRQIFEYDGTNKYAYVNRDWKVIPDSTSEYIISAHSGDTHVNEGVAQAGTATTIRLNSLASSVNDTYISQVVFIVAGTGADQARIINDYDGGTKDATVDTWDTNPDATSIYAILPAMTTTASNIWGTASSLTLAYSTLLERAYEMVNNKMTVNESTGIVALRDIGDSADIATGVVSSSGGVTDRDELSWS